MDQGPAQAPAGGACPPYGPGRAATMEPMRFRVQQLDNRENRFVLCVQPSASDPWRCRIVRARQLQQILDWLGFVRVSCSRFWTGWASRTTGTLTRYTGRLAPPSASSVLVPDTSSTTWTASRTEGRSGSKALCGRVTTGPPVRTPGLNDACRTLTERDRPTEAGTSRVRTDAVKKSNTHYSACPQRAQMGTEFGHSQLLGVTTPFAGSGIRLIKSPLGASSKAGHASSLLRPSPWGAGSAVRHSRDRSRLRENRACGWPR